MSRPRPKLSAKKIITIFAIFFAFSVLLPPFINANRFRKRLAASASGALGRAVTIGDVRVQLLPRPGFQITEFVVSDDPEFSAEPVIRAGEVTATLRLRSLWRGKFEIAELDLKYPSLNLVRNAAGDWNILNLLRYTSSLHAAPTTRAKAEGNPRFPYIQATSGRVNFKMLQEKTVYALADADFALWLESENQWNMRLEGRAMRTDANLNDTGTLRVEGSMQRGDTLGKSPLQFRATLQNAQLGQFSALLSGKDHGWRGNIDADAIAKGTAERLDIAADATIADFRRYDISNVEPLALKAHCTAALMKTADGSRQKDFGASPLLSDIECHSPIGQSGEIVATGNAAIAKPAHFEFRVSATNLPLASAAALLRKAKRNVPDDLTAAGVLSGAFILRRSAGQPQDLSASSLVITGKGHAESVRVASRSLHSVLETEAVNFGFDPAPVAALPRGIKRAQSSRKQNRSDDRLTAAALRVDPFIVNMGESEKVTCAGIIGGRQYSIQARGQGDVARFTAAARTFGLGNRLASAEGNIAFDISLAGAWSGFAAPGVSGTAQLRRVSAPVQGLNANIQIVHADLSLAPQQITVQRLVAGLPGTHVEGSMTIPRSCETASCPVNFDLQATEINFDDLNRILNPKFRNSSWSSLGGRLLGTSAPSSKLLQVDAIGRVSANRVILKSLAANKVTATLAIKHGVVEVRNLQADMLGGHYTGAWTANFNTDEPVYAGQSAIDNVPVAQVNALLHGSGGEGVITHAALKLKLTGSDARTLANTATGQLSFNWTDGAIALASAAEKPATLAFSSWHASAEIVKGRINLLSGWMQTAKGRTLATGSATFARELNLRLTDAGQSISITGTLDAPVFQSGANAASTLVESASNGKDAKPSKTP